MASGTDFLNGNIPLLIRQLAVPVSVGLFFNTMYNVVDTWYAGFLSTSGIAALTLSFPVFFTIFSVGHGISTATMAIVAGELGKSHEKNAARYFAQSLGFSLFISLIFMILGFWFVRPILSVMSEDVAAVRLAQTYLTVIFLGAPFLIVIGTLNAALTARGDTRSYRNFLIGGFFLNLALNPVFMFGFSPLYIPRMGVAGIALATVAIQGAGLIYLAKRAVAQGCFRYVKGAHFRMQPTVLKSITAQALPAAMGMILIAVGIFIINSFVSRAGDTDALAAYGIAMRIEQIALLPTIGLGTAMLTVAGQNSGAGRFNRIRYAYRISLFYGAIVMLIMLGLIIPFASFWISLFDDSPNVVSIGTTYLQIEMVTFYAYFAVFLSISLLQGLKRPMAAVWLGLYRQVLAPIVLFSVLISIFHLPVDSIWWGICGINWSAAIFVLFFSRKVLSRY